MKSIILALMLTSFSISSFAAESPKAPVLFPKRKPSSIDLNSSQDIVFYDRQNLGLSDMGKIPEYQGQLVFLNDNNVYLSDAELYKFPQDSGIAMTEKKCDENVVQIFGLPQDRAQQLQEKVKLFDTAVGKACEFHLKDSYIHAKLAYRFGVTGYIHGRMMTLIWSFPEKPTVAEVEKLKSYWKSLK